MERRIQASVFKAECLKIMDEVKLMKHSIVITKRKEPIAKLVPMRNKRNPLFGSMKGTLHITGDLIQPIGDKWDACL